MKHGEKKQERRNRRGGKPGFFGSLVLQIKKDKTAFIVYCILRVLVIAVIVRCAVQGQWESVFIGFLALLLFMLPPFVEKSFRVVLPTTLEVLVFVFVFCAEILGEIEAFYIKIPFWDTALHTVNGFMFAAFGFCLADILNKSKNIRFQLSPIYLAVVAFCFSMTIGALWEFFEFTADRVALTDMQKDRLVQTVSSTLLNEQGLNKAVILEGVTRTEVYYNGGAYIIEGGYLDIGIIDTIKDLMVNFVGAVVFSVIGYFYVKHRGKGKIASQFIPVFEDDSDADDASGKDSHPKDGES